MMANECRTATGSANEILQSHRSQNAKLVTEPIELHETTDNKRAESIAA